MTQAAIAERTTGFSQKTSCASTTLNFTVFGGNKPTVSKKYIFSVHSEYFEKFWLGIIGPSCVIVLRKICSELDKSPSGLSVDSEVFASCLGIGVRGGKNAPLFRTLTRLQRFGLVKQFSDGHYAVRTMVPYLSKYYLSRLPFCIQAEHRSHLASMNQD